MPLKLHIFICVVIKPLKTDAETNYPISAEDLTVMKGSLYSFAVPNVFVNMLEGWYRVKNVDNNVITIHHLMCR